jgi:hypothetical protein
MDDFYSKIIVSVASSTSLAILSYLVYFFRNAIRYKETEFTFEVEDHTDKTVTWDIQWEKQRLTLEANDISSDKITGVKILLNRAGKAEKLEVMEAKDSFMLLFDGEVQLRLASIVKATFRPGTKTALYILTFILRRRRRLL